MRVFFDTTVLVAASVRNHLHHAEALPMLQRVVDGQDLGFISAHSIAETFATLTRLQVTPRIHPSEAERIISENILPHFEVVPLTREDYMHAITVMREAGFSGPKIYDALILTCAERCEAEQIYTFNVHDFVSLTSPEQRAILSASSQPVQSHVTQPELSAQQVNKWDDLTQEMGTLQQQPPESEIEKER